MIYFAVRQETTKRVERKTRNVPFHLHLMEKHTTESARVNRYYRQSNRYYMMTFHDKEFVHYEKLEVNHFPFYFLLSYQDPNGELWCSTETDKRGRHKPGGGHWGYCHDGCDKKPIARVRKLALLD